MLIEAKAKCQSVDIMLRVVILLGTQRPIDVHCNQSRGRAPLSINLQTRAATSHRRTPREPGIFGEPGLSETSDNTCARMHTSTLVNTGPVPWNLINLIVSAACARFTGPLCFFP